MDQGIQTRKMARTTSTFRVHINELFSEDKEKSEVVLQQGVNDAPT